jgi:hypothetical protein
VHAAAAYRLAYIPATPIGAQLVPTSEQRGDAKCPYSCLPLTKISANWPGGRRCRVRAGIRSSRATRASTSRSVVPGATILTQTMSYPAASRPVTAAGKFSLVIKRILGWAREHLLRAQRVHASRSPMMPQPDTRSNRQVWDPATLYYASWASGYAGGPVNLWLAPLSLRHT